MKWSRRPSRREEHADGRKSEPGCATETPGGVRSRREPPFWMKAGVRIAVEGEGVGIFSNIAIDED